MLIDKVILNNYRVYQGINTVLFDYDHEKNITIISGNNGYGKTSFLTSLIWCLYGKLMADVDEKYKREILESGGYLKYCEKSLNKNFLNQSEDHRAADLYFSVTVELSRIFIPAIPCDHIEVVRKHYIKTGQETLEILLDHRTNELTKELGPEIFINDFILPREIAKFFFFDAEKIVSLAEMRSIEEKRQLSRAYSEVLGIKKYEDLKANLENIRFKLRKQTGINKDQTKLTELNSAIVNSEKLYDYYQSKITDLSDELARRKLDSDRCQERLIREGSTITMDELKELKLLKANTVEDSKMIKSKVLELMDFAPFAIAASKFNSIYEQMQFEAEMHDQDVSKIFLDTKLGKITDELGRQKDELKLDKTATNKILAIVRESLFANAVKPSSKSLLNFNTEEWNNFVAINDNLKNSYTKRLKDLSQNLKINQSTYSIISNKLRDAETKESNVVIQEIRKEKIRHEKEIARLEEDLIDIKAKLINLNNDRAIQRKQITELTKKVEVEETDRLKDEYASRLIDELSAFITSLKLQKKKSLEEKILSALHKLMHKADFIHRVEVIVGDNLIDIELIDMRGNLINKEGLSKGEQQLYATALLKALVEESNIRFPLFVDSPLQKFDKQHAHNIVTEFYPTISEQVVLFPLLEKELSTEEYGWLIERVNKVYLIEHLSQNSSQLREIDPQMLFNKEVIIENLAVSGHQNKIRKSCRS